MADQSSDIAALSAIVGAPIVAAEPGSWGFENRTTVVTLADSRRVVVQRMSSRAQAAHKIHLARVLPERLAAAGLRAPRLLSADADADPPYTVREYLPGDTGASWMGSLAGALELAGAMGELLPRLASVATSGAGLPSGWARPDRLARQARQQLTRCRPLLEQAEIAILEAEISGVPARFGGRPASFAHGDFCPVNVLLAEQASAPGGRRLAVTLIDLEFARFADSLFDAAWWGWVVRYHHPERWAHAWPRLLAAAGIPSDEATAARVRALQLLRCLELLDACIQAQAGAEAAIATWRERLKTTLSWT